MIVNVELVNMKQDNRGFIYLIVFVEFSRYPIQIVSRRSHCRELVDRESDN